MLSLDGFGPILTPTARGGNAPLTLCAALAGSESCVRMAVFAAPGTPVIEPPFAVSVLAGTLAPSVSRSDACTTYVKRKWELGLGGPVQDARRFVPPTSIST